MFLVVRRVVESFTTSYQPESMNEESISTFVYSLVITSWNSFHMKQNSRKGKNIEITYEYCGYICKSNTIIVAKQQLLLLLLFPKPMTSKLNARIDPVTLNKSSSNWRGPSQVLLYNSTNDDGNGNDEN